MLPYRGGWMTYRRLHLHNILPALLVSLLALPFPQAQSFFFQKISPGTSQATSLRQEIKGGSGRRVKMAGQLQGKGGMTDEEEQQQKKLFKAREVASSFQHISRNTHKLYARYQTARAFSPPFWGKNEHWQTIWGARALQDAVIQVVAPSSIPRGWQDIYDRRERWETIDNDFFHVDYLFATDKKRRQRSAQPSSPPHPIVIVLHGLESTSSALLPRSMAKAFAKRGFDVLALNFRGCCGNDNVKPYSYHLGFTDDIKYVVRRLHEEDPRRRIYLSGFSLGGNVILKSLGELGQEASRLGVEGAAVACVPFDAVKSSGKLDSGFNRMVYVANFLSTLKVKAERKWRKHSEENIYDLERVLSCTKIGDFDDEVIAKLHNFSGKIDYYQQTCSKQYLHRIHVPTLVINAIDDPFINEEGLPTQDEVKEAPVRLVYHQHGGHCGFVTGQEKFGESEEDRFLPTELATFLNYVEEPLRPFNSDVDGQSPDASSSPSVPSMAAH